MFIAVMLPVPLRSESGWSNSNMTVMKRATFTEKKIIEDRKSVV